ncbi:MAG: GerW family sporulation protein [Elusimicrobiota bacterium]
MNEALNKELGSLFEKLQEFLTSRTIIGKEIQVGDTTLIPVIELTFGMGSGSSGGMDEKKQQGSGEGVGFGAKARPSAVIVIQKGQVELLPLGKPGALEKIMEKIPDIMDRIPKTEETKQEKK